MEKVKLNNNWNIPEEYYIYCKYLEQEGFESSPTISRTISLVKIEKGYGFEEGFGVIESWAQLGHSKYSDCSEDQLKQFTNLKEATEYFKQLSQEYSKKYPN